MVANNAIEKRLWAADQLWANSDLEPSELSTPVLLIFLRYAGHPSTPCPFRIPAQGFAGTF